MRQARAKIDVDRVPAELVRVRQWVCWKTVLRGGHPTKIPFEGNGREAKSNDPKTWLDFDEAVGLMRTFDFDGVGFVFRKDDPFCGVDLDGCRDNAGKAAPWARKIITDLDSYTEVSPSGTGFKVFIRAASPFDTGRKRDLPDEPRVSEKTPGIEIYDRLRYFAVTGLRVQGQKTTYPRQAALDALCAEFFPAGIHNQKTGEDASAFDSGALERARAYMQRIPPAVSGESGHNQTFKAACILVLGFGLTQGEAFLLLAEWNARCSPPWTEPELRHKIEDAGKQSGQRNYLRTVRPEHFGKVTVPDYEQPKMAELETLEQAAARYIETIRSGENTLITTGISDLDYALGGGIEKGEMVILGARPSHGKSAVALQMAHTLTSEGLRTLILSEEMSALALGKRTIQFATGVPQEHWEHDLNKVELDLGYHFEKRVEAYIATCGTMEMAERTIRQIVREKAIEVLIVDYAQLLSSKGKSRYEQITNTSVALRRLTSEFGLVSLVLCQLSRAIEERATFSPMLSDLRDTGQLEQDADVIVFLCWPHRLNQQRNPHDFRFFIGKNRNRAINQPCVDASFKPSRQLFDNAAMVAPSETYDAKSDK